MKTGSEVKDFMQILLKYRYDYLITITLAGYFSERDSVFTSGDFKL